MQVQGYQKKSVPELLRAIDACTSIGQVCALVQHEGIVIQMKAQQSASNLPAQKLPHRPTVSPLDSLKAQVKEAAMAQSRRHTKDQLIRAVELCPSIDKLFELVKNEHIVIRMKAQHAASCLPQPKLSGSDLMPDKPPLERLKEQVLDAVRNGG